ncbi:MAG: hypothetical protein E7610_04430 [Ruminococcaceae bacterium]|nr:hypothetical protein [Oscillospiraceae bacterium]
MRDVKLDFFVLPVVMRRDFVETFVLEKEDFAVQNPDWVRRMEEQPSGFDAWYTGAFLWEKMSAAGATTDFDGVLELLRARAGKVLFMSESETSGHGGGLRYKGRMVYDFVAMADPKELADLIEYEWKENSRLLLEDRLTLPEDLYVFDTTLDWAIVFTHESVETGESSEVVARCCRVIGL